MSTLHTLHDAFVELEHRADARTAEAANSVSPTPDGPGSSRHRATRRWLAPVASVAAPTCANNGSSRNLFEINRASIASSEGYRPENGPRS